MGTGTLSFGVNLPGREADTSHPSSIEVRKAGAISPLPISSDSVVLNQLSTGTCSFLRELMLQYYMLLEDGGESGIAQ